MGSLGERWHWGHGCACCGSRSFGTAVGLHRAAAALVVLFHGSAECQEGGEMAAA